MKKSMVSLLAVTGLYAGAFSVAAAPAWPDIKVEVKADQPVATKQTLKKQADGFQCLAITLSNKGKEPLTIEKITVHIPVAERLTDDLEMLYGGSCMGQTPLLRQNVGTQTKQSSSHMYEMVRLADGKYLFAGSLSWRIFLPNFTLTNVERMRLGLQAMRDAVGKENYLLGCSAVFGPCIGFVNGMRTGGDISPRYDAFPERSLANLGHFYLSGKVFNGDIDYLTFRTAADEDDKVSKEEVKRGGTLTMNEAQMWADLNKLYGNCRLNSDNLVTLRPERQNLVKEVFEYPPMDETVPLDVWQRATSKGDGFELVLARKGKEIYLGVFNWSAAPKEYALAAFGKTEPVKLAARHSVILNGMISKGDWFVGFYMGSDGYCPTRTFFSKHSVTQGLLEVQRQWYMFMVWGRLSYNPATADTVFKNHMALRYPKVSSESLFAAWARASSGLPKVGDLITGTLGRDNQWWPEACQSDDGFLTVADFGEAKASKGSALGSIAETASGQLNGRKSAYAVTDEIEADALSALALVTPMKASADSDLGVAINNIKTMSYLTLYYAHKIRGATHLKAKENEKAKNALGSAYCWWMKYSNLMDSMYHGMAMARTVDLPNWHAHDQSVLKEYADLGGVGTPGCDK